ncbi:MAG: ABC transporter ATP-binding protein [Oscillospiraceae bacterium]
MEEQAVLQLKGIQKSFGETRVLQDLTLTVHKGEFITLLGSSGCGKTTTLRLIAGLEKPDEGTILLNGQDVTNLPPNKRDVNMVFQNYALFPHMNVAANIAYSLKLKKLDKQKIKEEVESALILVQLQGYEKRMPVELSGGQRQRVAIARALVNQPQILLLDEPLGALDLQLRRQMQHELKQLQKRLGITFVYITHDQEEALNMSDRIAVMRDGDFEQIGTPQQVYNHPKTVYVARFVGNSNILQGRVERIKDEYAEVKSEDGSFWIQQPKSGVTPGQEVAVALRSENVAMQKDDAKQAADLLQNNIPAIIAEKSFTGGQLRIMAKTPNGTEIVSNRYGIDSDLEVGQAVFASFLPQNAVVVEQEASL